ncbi:hypothetical protein PSMK_12450 [Phycisphaera mikurensis NBRC 102666]|uniref:Uncharacterized protein n=1 Tax=Phycisphaera mikurensis (strain NBRC 102666 / KCTC 22515 / FYK2301M01) TaxID=1142394 RepID=I0IDR6_PHYMF|nr:hypothetical protein PSMK_12450 [Phycisphaera mikurensis NBRC 102666]
MRARRYMGRGIRCADQAKKRGSEEEGESDKPSGLRLPHRGDATGADCFTC